MALCALLLTGLACGDGDADQVSESGDAAEMCIPNNGDGQTQCGADVCQAGERCSPNGLVQCLPGCLETLNCGPEQWCDLRTAEPGDPGLCRSIDDPACGGAPGGGTDDTGDAGETAGTDDSASSGEDTTDASCPDVQGNYDLNLSETSPEECQQLLASGDVCSVSQDGCNITWGCESEYAMLWVPGPVDASGIYEATGTIMGFAYTCEVEFLSTGAFVPDLEWSCSVGQGGQALLCEGTGFL